MTRIARPTIAAFVLAVVAAAGGAQEPMPRSGKGPPATDSIDVRALGARLLADTSRALPLDPAVRSGTLPNGLRYYVRRNTRPAQRAELRLVVNAGSVLETDAQRGLAHFVEHMAFNGTRRFEKQTLVDFLERSGMRFGAHVNAYTSFDETVYMLRVPTDRGGVVDTAFQVLEDWAGGIAFDSVEVERERGVVIEEWRLGQGADERVREQQFPVLFAGSRYADRLPIGDRRTLETFSRERLVEFYRDWYRPDLMAVIVVGDIDPDDMVRRIQAGFGTLRAPADSPPRTIYPVPIRDTTSVAVAADAELTTSMVNVYHLQPVRGGRSVGAFRQMLVEALYNGMLNRRFSEMTQRPDAPFVGAYSAQGRYVRSSEFYALGAMAREGGVERALEAVLHEAERVDRHGFTAGELARATSDLRRAFQQGFAEREHQESGALAAEYVDHYLNDEPAPGIDVQHALVEAFAPTITLAEVNALARAWITDRGRVVLASVPEKQDVPAPTEASLRAAIARAGSDDVAAYDDDVADAPLLPVLPPPGRVLTTARDSVLGTTTWILSNGVRVVVKPTDFKADEVLVSAFSPGGTSLVGNDDIVAAGLAPFAATAGGVGEFDAIALRKKLAGQVVDVTPYVAELTEGIVGSASPRDLETFFQLFHLYMTAPRRDSAAFEAMQQNFRTVYENRALNPNVAFNDTLTVVLSQHHPRRQPLTAARIDSVTLDRALEVYRDRFADAGDFTVVIVGSVTPEAVRPLVEQYLGSLPAAGRVERGRDLGIRPPAGRVERTVRRGIEPQSSTAMVFSSDFEFTQDNRLAFGAAAEVLTIRLRERLREALGATYGVSVGAGVSKFPREAASLSVRFGSAPERSEELVREVLAEIDSLRTNGPPADVLAKVKETMLRERETNLRENSYWLERIAGALERGEDPRDILNAEERVRALTPERVRDAARRWIAPERYVRVTLLPER